MTLSPSTFATSLGSSRSSHSPQAGDLLLELGAKENVVATWDLRMRDSAEFKRSVQATVLVGSGIGNIGRECVFHLRLSFQIIDRVSFF